MVFFSVLKGGLGGSLSDAFLLRIRVRHLIMRGCSVGGVGWATGIIHYYATVWNVIVLYTCVIKICDICIKHRKFLRRKCTNEAIRYIPRRFHKTSRNVTFLVVKMWGLELFVTFTKVTRWVFSFIINELKEKILEEWCMTPWKLKIDSWNQSPKLFLFLIAIISWKYKKLSCLKENYIDFSYIITDYVYKIIK